eukprot:scaffold40512_cov59-Attheya_sp.AAC.1
MTKSNNAMPSTRSTNNEERTALTAIATPPHDRTNSRTQQRKPPSILRMPSTNSSKKSPNKDSTQKPRSVKLCAQEKRKKKIQKNK